MSAERSLDNDELKGGDWAKMMTNYEAKWKLAVIRKSLETWGPPMIEETDIDMIGDYRVEGSNATTDVKMDPYECDDEEAD